MKTERDEPVVLPTGWGFPPGYQLLSGRIIDVLPELPMLRLLNRQQRADAIVAELVRFPRFREVRQRDLQVKYQLPSATAHGVLERARRYA